MNNPLVSVIVPVYNCGKYIGKCLTSILGQEYQDIEVIVIDDGSTDDSKAIITTIAETDARIRYMYQSNQGVAVTRNNGIASAAGKYLTFIDGDDYIGETYISSLVQAAENNDSELVICGYTTVESVDNKDLYKQTVPGEYIQGEKEEWAYRISGVLSRLYRLEFWNSHDIHFTQEKNARGEDVPIAIYTNVMAKNIRVISECGYYYVQHSNSAMGAVRGGRSFEFPYVAIKGLHERVAKHELTDISISSTSLDYYYVGLIKFLAQFKYQIFGGNEKSKKQELIKFGKELLTKEERKKVRLAWKEMKWKCDLPIQHKVAIELYIMTM